MQEITFAKGNEQHLKDCRDALCQSMLGERYFSSPGSAEDAILEGIRQENLYVAFIGEEYMGLPGMKSSEAANEKQYGKKRKSRETSRIYDENY